MNLMCRMKGLLLKIMPLVLFSPGSLQAQNDVLIGKQCSLNENLKGTCFYTEKGEISYWIIRYYETAKRGGAAVGAEFIGYPAALEAQQKYNKFVKALNDRPLKNDAARSIIQLTTPPPNCSRCSRAAPVMDARRVGERKGIHGNRTHLRGRGVP